MEIPVELTKKAVAKENAAVAATVTKIERKFCKSKKPTGNGGAYGTGRRKNAIARVWLKPGTGKITVNKRLVSDYFTREFYIKQIIQPFTETGTFGQYDVVCTATGGGTTGQAGAIRHGIARALDCMSEDFHMVLRKSGMLTRDPRVVERKKYGLRKARKSVQFSKR